MYRAHHRNGPQKPLLCLLVAPNVDSEHTQQQLPVERAEVLSLPEFFLDESAAGLLIVKTSVSEGAGTEKPKGEKQKEVAVCANQVPMVLGRPTLRLPSPIRVAFNWAPLKAS